MDGGVLGRGARALFFVAGGFALSCSSANDGLPSDGVETTILSTEIVSGERIAIDPGKGAGVFVEYETGGKWHVFTTCDTLLYGYACHWDLVASVSSRAELAVDDESDLESVDLVQRVDPGAVRLSLLNSNDEPLQPEPADSVTEADGGVPRAEPYPDAGASPASGDAGAAPGTPDGGETEMVTPASDIDGVFLSAPAGEPLRLDVVLDGAHGIAFDGTSPADLVFWIGPTPRSSVEPVQVRSGAPSNPIDFVPTEP